MKRALDVVAALAGIVVLAPVGALAALLVGLGSGGPVLYHAPRVGRGGRAFRMHKFRTMAVGRDGPALAVTADGRVTRVGRVLRRTHLDELPQLWNVLVGEMSLVGPRPEDPRFVAEGDSTWHRVLSVRPGITGVSQLAFAGRETRLLGPDDPERDYRERVLPEKLRMDASYVDGRTLRGDLVLVLRTALLVAGAGR